MQVAPLTALMLLGTIAGACAAPECLVPTGEYLPTQLPYTYVLDRRSPFDQTFLDRYQEGIPSLIETGTLTPGHPYFGPTCDLAALRAGRPEKGIAEFVEDYRSRREQAPEAIRRLHEAGADRVITYICMMTTGGDPERRTGFWRFYDNWEAFEEFNIPAKPEEDPENWQQRKPDGSPYIAYRREHPPYAPIFRWTNCINNPSWRTYQRWVTEEAARIGVDGFFVDNAGTMHCHCKYCQAKFADRLRSRYTEQEIQELFDGDLSMAPEGDRNSDLRKAEVKLFHQESIHELLSDIRQWGAAIHGEFFVFPNGLHRRAHFVTTRFRDTDLAMDENSSGELGGNPGASSAHIIAGLHIKGVNDNILTYKYAAGTGARCRGNVLAYAGHPNSDPEGLGAGYNTAVLAMAEPAAFGGGGCYAPVGGAQDLERAIALMNDFFDANRGLLAGKYPFGRVGVLGFALPNYFDDATAYAATGQVLKLLMRAHILADIIPERVFTPDWIARWPALVVPHVRIMSDSQLQALVDYAKAGGKLVLLGSEIATRDQLGRERPAEEIQPLLEAASASHGLDFSACVREGGPLHGLALCDREVAPEARFAAYVDHPDRPTELILHAVNYDVQLGTAHGEVGEVENLGLSVPLPPGTAAASATLKAPGDRDISLTVECKADRASLTIPMLHIYGIVHIRLTGVGQ